VIIRRYVKYREARAKRNSKTRSQVFKLQVPNKVEDEHDTYTSIVSTLIVS
jgi:hypothetical protein